ncbi:anti-sigma factor [Paenibacillus rhizovicinus]|uniref:Anti-sigma factor n=1 Tax=Paenibacillus rhizovicinus TaxID=2704463 RepID=A0A6C0P6W2_9BACL|nr:anti-sigma factor [Paenibacillus rhizovicinus]QHW34086.1 anti-sigma factor [Paenibacillus rhizovicinus]
MNGTPDYEPETCGKHYAEEDWIDWLLDRKPPADRAVMLSHLARCSRCLSMRNMWEPLLAGGGMTGTPPATEQERGRGEEVRESSQPSEALRRRLRARVRLRSAGIRVRRAVQAQRRTSVFAAAIVMLLLLCAALVYRSASPSQADQRKVAAAALEPTAASFLQDPQTASFKVNPELEELGKGYIWFNDMSGEVYVMLEGLLPSEEHDVQVWAVDELAHEHVNLGLLHHDRPSSAHLYVKPGRLLQARHIALTVEPAGGSGNPTGPDVLVFPLQRG